MNLKYKIHTLRNVGQTRVTSIKYIFGHIIILIIMYTVYTSILFSFRYTVLNWSNTSEFIID